MSSIWVVGWQINVYTGRRSTYLSDGGPQNLKLQPSMVFQLTCIKSLLWAKDSVRCCHNKQNPVPCSKTSLFIWWDGTCKIRGYTNQACWGTGTSPLGVVRKARQHEFKEDMEEVPFELVSRGAVLPRWGGITDYRPREEQVWCLWWIWRWRGLPFLWSKGGKVL